MTPTPWTEERHLAAEEMPSLMELGRRFHAREATLHQTLEWMKQGSCSVLLNWSEDDRDHWECSWIVGGKRYTGFRLDIREAVLEAIVNCINGNLPEGQKLEDVTNRQPLPAPPDATGEAAPEGITDGLEAIREAAAPLIRFLELFEKKPLGGLDCDEIYGIHGGDSVEGGLSLRYSYIRKLRAAIDDAILRARELDRTEGVR